MCMFRQYACLYSYIFGAGVTSRECHQLGHQEDLRGSRLLPGRGQEGGALQDQQGLLCLRRGGWLLPRILIHGCRGVAPG